MMLPASFSCAFLIALNFLIGYQCQDVDFGDDPPRRAYFSMYDSTHCEKNSWFQKPFQSMRIESFIVDLSEIANDSQEVIKEVLLDVGNFYSKVLRVRRADGSMGIDLLSTCRDAMTVYPEHVRIATECQKNVTEGVTDLDFLVYVFARGHDRGYKWWCDNTGILAWAMPCAVSPIDDRPIAGIVNICPQKVNTKDWNRLSLKSLLRHELLHALGFTTDTGLNHKLKRTNLFTRHWKINDDFNKTHFASLVTTPRVKAFVRKHFNCSDLEGAELENEGGGSTAYTHWEKRIFGPEVMTGYISRQTFFSDLTLAFLEDTGWYETNHSMAEPYKFAQGAGCIYAKQSCREYMDYKSNTHGENAQAVAKPYCNWADYLEKMSHGSTVRECSKDHQYFTSCDWTTTRETRTASHLYHYFSDKWTMLNGKNVSGANLTGDAHWSDSCPQWSEILYAESPKSGAIGRIGDTICSNAFSQPPAQVNWGAEQYSDNDSICIKQDGKFEVFECVALTLTEYSTERAHGAGCYKYKCERGRLMIQANFSDDSDKTFMKAYKVCWSEGSVINIRRHQQSGKNGEWRYHKGILVCPPCKEICENNTKYPNFRCSKGIRINSTDYSKNPCTIGGSRSYMRACQTLLSLLNFASILLYISLSY